MDKVANFMPHHFNLYHQCSSRMPHYRENSERDGSVTRNNLTRLVCDCFLIKVGGLFSCVIWSKVENAAPSIDTKRLLTFKYNILNNNKSCVFFHFFPLLCSPDPQLNFQGRNLIFRRILRPYLKL